MKAKFLFTAIAFAVVATACNKVDSVIVRPEPGPVAGPGECILTVNTGDVATKVGNQSEAAEKTIWNVQVFVFRAGDSGDAGYLEAAKSAGSFTPVVPGAGDTPLSSNGNYSGLTVKCSTGLREVWVVCNDSQDHTSGPDAIQTKEEFLALTHALENSSPSKFLMIGRSNPDGADPVITLNEGASEVSVPVHRLAACVVLRSVKNAMMSPAYQKAGIFRLDACYLLNVPGWIDFAEATSSSDDATPYDKWYAKLAPETAGNRAAILYDSINQLLEYDGNYANTHSFYSYRNSEPASELAEFAPRATVLVLEASIKYKTSTGADNWVKYYYPVSIAGGLQANKKYVVDMTINRPGSTDPNKPVTFNEMTPTITVSNWEDGDAYTPVI